MINFYTNVYLYKNEILLRGYENNKRVQYAIKYKPYIFINSRTHDSKYRTLTGKSVDKLEFSDVYEARDYIKRYSDVDGIDIYGLTNFLYTFIYDYYPGTINYDPNLINITSIDIETDSSGGFPDIEKADKQITAITISKKGKKVVFGYHDFVVPNEMKQNVVYMKCKDESDLLINFIKVWRSSQFLPDVVTGWNCEFFDMPYIIKRIKRILGNESANRLSPWGIITEREIEILNKIYIIPEIVGITIIDYLPLYKKFSFAQRESYKLDYIAFYELGKKKVDYTSQGYVSLDDLYQRNFQLYIEYNIQDVQLVDDLEDKLKFIEQVFALAYDGKVNYLDTFTSVRSWDVYIHNELMTRNTVIPQFDPKSRTKDEQIEGAYVKEPSLGMHNWVVSFDLNSLYPHLIMQYNISPETYSGQFASLNVRDGVDKILKGALYDENLRKKIIDSNVAVAASGCVFDKDYQGFLSQIMEKLYNDRVKYKEQMIKAKKEYELIIDEIQKRNINVK